MSRRPEKLLTFRPLYRSPIIGVRDYCCCAGRGGPAGEEHSASTHIVLMRRGAYCKHVGRRHATADVNQAVFFTKDVPYRVSHPAECGDRGTVFAPSPRVLNDIIRELDPTVNDHPERPFFFITGPCDTSLFCRHRELVQRLENAEAAPLEPIWADVTALQIIADVLEAAFAAAGGATGKTAGRSLRRRRAGTDADHVDRAEAAKTYLASRLHERITLDDVARAVHASPFHLARVFQQRTGVPVHRYLTRLRLRASLERLADGTDDLTSLALDLGFSSHSHFTDAFRREFGRPPSDVRRSARGHRLETGATGNGVNRLETGATGAMLREMSKNLEA